MKSLLPTALQSAWDVQDTVTRRARLCELAFAGYQIPRCGEFSEMRRLGVPLVVYRDERAHCGQGKVLWRPGEAVDWPPSAFCSQYVPDSDGFENNYEHEGSTQKTSLWVSRRELWVGRWMVELKYTSRVSWMANVGGEYEVVVGPTPSEMRYRELIRYPMFAVDYTRVGDDWTSHDYHFDLNVCPHVPVEVVNAVGRETLRASIEDFCKSRGLL